MEKTENGSNTISSVKFKENINNTTDKDKNDSLNYIKDDLLNKIKEKKNNRLFTVRSLLGDTWSKMTKDEQNIVSLWFDTEVKLTKIPNVKFSHAQKNNKFYRVTL